LLTRQFHFFNIDELPATTSKLLFFDSFLDIAFGSQADELGQGGGRIFIFELPRRLVVHWVVEGVVSGVVGQVQVFPDLMDFIVEACLQI
jgi:hypothetical protein